MQRNFYRTQLSLKSGLKEWRDRAYEAAESEMKQLHFRNTFGSGILKWWVDASFAPSLHAGTFWWGIISGKGFPKCKFHQAKTQHPQFPGNRTCGCRRLHTGNLLDKIFLGSSRLPCTGQRFISRQQKKCHSFGEER
jgi:hypothetical protein